MMAQKRKELRTGQRVRSLRKARYMTQTQLAEKTGLSQCDVARIEQGSTLKRKKPDWYECFVPALGTTMSYLVDGVGKRKGYAMMALGPYLKSGALYERDVDLLHAYMALCWAEREPLLEILCTRVEGWKEIPLVKPYLPEIAMDYDESAFYLKAILGNRYTAGDIRMLRDYILVPEEARTGLREELLRLIRQYQDTGKFGLQEAASN